MYQTTSGLALWLHAALHSMDLALWNDNMPVSVFTLFFFIYCAFYRLKQSLV